ncbi:DUF3899 domain-containing protein [Salipaludibacillus sp. CF4.18]|uniref:DUF3899 domain-containing protein n=1 Tax=Salipaludibacillus sp. CF4.18 TaxID=3373081 RepID=UPI003EE57583
MLPFIYNKWIVLLLNFFFSFLLFIVFAPTSNLLHYINALFYVALAYLIVWLISFIIKGRFLDGIIHGFSRVGKRLLNDEFESEWSDERKLSTKISSRFLNLVLFQVLVLLFIMSGLLFIYYM